jgi:hypothetical protein
LFRKAAINKHRRKKSTNESEGKKAKQKFDAAFGIIFRIIKRFQRNKQKYFLFFSLKNQNSGSDLILHNGALLPDSHEGDPGRLLV